MHFVVGNPTSQSDEMIGVECDAARTAQMHLSKRDSNIVMTMNMQASVPIPAKGQVEFKPGEYHITLLNLDQNLFPGDTTKFVVVFQKVGKITFDVPIGEP